MTGRANWPFAGGGDRRWKFGRGGDRYLPADAARPRTYREDEACYGWPEIGSCGRAAQRGRGYCAECDEARRAHEGTADEDETDD